MDRIEDKKSDRGIRELEGFQKESILMRRR
jgi:hypothetical protein